MVTHLMQAKAAWQRAVEFQHQCDVTSQIGEMRRHLREAGKNIDALGITEEDILKVVMAFNSEPGTIMSFFGGKT